MFVNAGLLESRNGSGRDPILVLIAAGRFRQPNRFRAERRVGEMMAEQRDMKPFAPMRAKRQEPVCYGCTPTKLSQAGSLNTD
jgi:hypothetical protein